MSIPLPTRAEIEQAAIAYFQTAHRDPITGAAPPLGPRTFLGQEARALANLLNEVLASVKSVDDDAIPGTYIDAQGVTRTRNSAKALEDWAYVLGVPSSIAGQYGRQGARAARGGTANATGTMGVVVSTGAQLTDLSGSVTVKVRAGITLDGTDGIVLDAITTGVSGNLPVGTILRWTSPPPGLAATVTLTGALNGGQDIESDVSLALRILNKLQSPLRGGACADYRYWAENAVDDAGVSLGVDRAYIYPCRFGTGTVDIVITKSGSGSDRLPDSTMRAAVLAYVERYRPAGDGLVRVLSPRNVIGQDLSIRIRVEPQPDYDFDWDDGQGVYPIICAAGSTGTSLVIDYAGSPSTYLNLKSIFDQGAKPRIQIHLTNLTLPFIARVVYWDNDQPSVGQATLTLDTALPGGTIPDPVAGDYIYAAGSAVPPVAAAVLALVDSIGPSRKSRKADPLDRWQDEVSVALLGKAVINATDTDGIPVCVTTKNIGNVASTVEPGVLIKVGSGTEAEADFVNKDSLLTQGPQIAKCVSILVHKSGT